MSTTKIEWATKVWNPVTGCTKISEACQNCYAERFAHRLQTNPKTMGKYSEGFRVQCHENELNVPFKWNKPERIFVCSMGDLFHEDVPFAFIRKVIGTIYNKPKHTFMVLTKRPNRMAEFFRWLNNPSLSINFPNLWLGTTVENQKRAEERIPVLMEIPAAVRFITCEPMLGWIRLNEILGDNFSNKDIQWVIAGGETGPKARPSHPFHFYSLLRQCHEAKIPFFFKSWGEWIDIDHGYDIINDHPFKYKTQTVGSGFSSTDMFMVGKKQAGRILFGKEYNEFPKL